MLSQRTAIRLLEHQGWVRTRGGVHVVKMQKDGQRPITLPRHRGGEYGRGLTHAILKQAGLGKEDLEWSSRSSYARKGRDTGQRSSSYRGASRQAER
jgi:predicted RNA binding protein YcfA (HicA-like mRNA interferase family)